MTTQNAWRIQKHICTLMTKLVVSGKYIDVIETKIRADLLNYMKWMEKNKLTMNL